MREVRSTECGITLFTDSPRAVPPGVLTVLPGYGPKTGKAIVSNPCIRKVDITVSPGW